MSDIFISYKRDEHATAKCLAVALERHGWSVWWDPHLRSGEHYDDVIENALSEAKCVIVLWSTQSVNSRYVRDEATYALNKSKLIPVAIEEVDPPFRFTGLQTAQLHDWDGSDAFPGFLKLVDDIQSKIAPPAALQGEEKATAKDESHKAAPDPQPKSSPTKTPTARTKVEWLLNIVALATLGLFYFAAVANACSNDDLLALSALIGFPISLFLILLKRPYRITWIVLPLTSFFIGIPYGHNYGTITESSLFGLKQGSSCQSGPEVLIILAILALVAVIDHAVFFHRSKR